MDRDQLLAFARVVQQGTFSRAAVTLGIGQPALSARIRALEQQIGGALFSRGRRVALTSLGTSFLPYVRRALAVLDEGERVARATQRGERGRVTLATLGSLAGGLVGPALSEFLQTHPDVECLVRSGDHEFILQLLWDNVVELGLVAWPCHDAMAEELTVLKVFSEPVVLAVAPGHALARKGTVKRADLLGAGIPLLKLRWWPQHDETLSLLADATGSAIEIPMEPARHLVRAGSAIGFFSHTYVAEDLQRKALASVRVTDLPEFHRKSALVRRARPPLSPAASDLVATIESHAERLGLLATRKRTRAASNGKRFKRRA